MKLHTAILLALSGASLLTACTGGSDSTPAATNSSTTTTETPVVTQPTTAANEVMVERGPLLYANVVDATQTRSMPVGNGVYRFENAPTYPISTLGGYIDVNRNGVIDSGDVKAGTLTLKSNQAGSSVTLGSTLASNTLLNEKLLALGFTSTQLLNNTPSNDRMIAALSDEIYSYCITHNISDASQLSSAQLDALSSAIKSRIANYQGSSATTAQLEQVLMAQLANQVVSVDAATAANLSTASNSDIMMSSLPAYSLSAAQKETLAYMWNEEKLAKDIYLALNGIYPSQQLSNIATKAETQHESSVEALLKKYNLSVTDVLNSSGTAVYSAAVLAAIPAGSYTLPELQSLYNALYAEGSISTQKSLEVGCKVEVTDVNDLDKDLVIATGAQDLVVTFENLRSGSYNHYWAFDKGLKNMGIATGCCSLGNDFCHPEYPNNNESEQNGTATTTQGNGTATTTNSNTTTAGNGNQYGKN